MRLRLVLPLGLPDTLLDHPLAHRLLANPIGVRLDQLLARQDRREVRETRRRDLFEPPLGDRMDDGQPQRFLPAECDVLLHGNPSCRFHRADIAELPELDISALPQHRTLVPTRPFRNVGKEFAGTVGDSGSEPGTDLHRAISNMKSYRK